MGRLLVRLDPLDSKTGGFEQRFSKKIKFGRTITARQDQWAGSDTKDNPWVYPRPINSIY